MGWLIVSVLAAVSIFAWWCDKNNHVEDEIGKTIRETDEFIKQMKEKQNEQNK